MLSPNHKKLTFNFQAGWVIILPAVSFLAASGLVIFSTSKIFDFDSLYHFRHAWLYRTAGLFTSSFPWVQYSVINLYEADLWYGFHWLLLPFTYLPDPLLGVRLSTFFFSALGLLSFWWLLRSFSIRYPFFWTALLFFSSGDFLFRLFMSRPHVLSLFISFLLLGSLAHSRRFRSFLLAAVFAWLHLSLSWVPLLIAFINSFGHFLLRRRLAWPEFFSVLGGLSLGWLLRPRPFASARLAYIQIVELFLAKQNNLPLKFGRELAPLRVSDVWLQYIPLLFFFALIVVAAFWLYQRRLFSELKPVVWIALFSSGLLSLLFLIMSFAVARRSTDFFSGFLVIFASLLVSSLLASDRLRYLVNRSLLRFSFIFLLVVMIINSFWIFNSFIINTLSPDQFRDVSLWLKDHTSPGDIVFNAYWDNFPNLFFWNPHNYYIGGMDPIFQYAYDPSLYWKAHFIAYTGEPYTCGAIRCTADTVEDIHTVLSRDFQADYLIVEPRRSLNLFQNLKTLPGFELVFTGREALVFKILPVSN